MKKIIFILAICLLAFGLIFGCDEVTNDPNNPNPVVNDPLHDSALTGEWEVQDNMTSGNFTFDGKENFSMVGYYNGEKTGEVSGKYKTISGEFFLYDVVATTGQAYDINATYTAVGNTLTIDPTNGIGTTLILTKKGTTPKPQEDLMPPALPE